MTATAATLNGLVASDRSGPGSYWFEYGPSRDYGNSTEHRPLTYSSNVKQPVSERISGLEAWTEYHYRLCAEDNDPAVDALCSKDAKFTTGDPQITLGPDRPRYELHVEAADGDSAGDSPDNQSGVTGITIEVDGTEVDAKTPGCPDKNCELSHDWTLEAADYAPGLHTLRVVATDGVEHTTERELVFEIQRDTTRPSLRASGPLRTAPEGWVDQRSYTLTAEAADSGHGVTSVKVLIDDQQVGQPATQPCPDGGCTLNRNFTVNAANYGGGAHEVKLVATDGAGNTTTRSWPINVNPDGWVPAAEAIDTLEAADSTSESLNVAPNSEYIDPAERAAGNDPSLEQTGSALESSGAPTPTTMTTDPSDGFAIHAPGDTIQITPVGVASNATTTAITQDAVGVAANTSANVDSGVRPVYNGDMTFQAIRDKAAVEAFSWRLLMDPDQSLRSIDSKYAMVDWSDGTAALGISAQVAHDATGATVPTSLSVSGNVVTLTVSHHAGNYVYPISAGQGWEAPYQVQIEGDVGGLSCPYPPPDPRGAACADPSNFTEIIPAPDFNRGLTINQRDFKQTVCANKILAAEGCSVWRASVYGEFVKFRNEKVEIDVIPGPRCRTVAEGHPLPFADTDVEWAGWTGPVVAHKGSGKHLTASCQFNITSPCCTLGQSPWTACYGLHAWIWPNGYQERRVRERHDYPSPCGYQEL